MKVRVVNKRSKKQGNAYSMVLFITNVNEKCNMEVGLKYTYMGGKRQTKIIITINQDSGSLLEGHTRGITQGGLPESVLVVAWVFAL